LIFNIFICFFLYRYHHDTVYEAYDYLLERRRMAAPNLAFLLQLIRYENQLRSAKECLFLKI